MPCLLASCGRSVCGAVGISVMAGSVDLIRAAWMMETFAKKERGLWLRAFSTYLTINFLYASLTTTGRPLVLLPTRASKLPVAQVRIF